MAYSEAHLDARELLDDLREELRLWNIACNDHPHRPTEDRVLRHNCRSAIAVAVDELERQIEDYENQEGRFAR
jgi:hypothetical protein